MINDFSDELTKLKQDVVLQKDQLDSFFENWTDSSLDSSKTALYAKKEELDGQIRLLVGHIYRIKDLLFSGENRDKRNEVEAEVLIEEITDSIQFFHREFSSQNEAEALSILSNLGFILEQGQETLDNIQNLLSE